MTGIPILNNYLILGGLLFSFGMVGFLARRNLIVMFLCAELMLQGVSVTLVGFAAHHQTWGGQVLAIASLAIAASEAAVGLALIVMLFKRGGSLDVSIWQDLREPDQPPVDEEPLAPDEMAAPEPEYPELTPSGVLPSGKQPIGPSTTRRPREVAP